MNEEQRYWESIIQDKVTKILNTISYKEFDEELQKIMDYHCV